MLVVLTSTSMGDRREGWAKREGEGTMRGSDRDACRVHKECCRMRGLNLLYTRAPGHPPTCSMSIYAVLFGWRKEGFSCVPSGEIEWGLSDKANTTKLCSYIEIDSLLVEPGSQSMESSRVVCGFPSPQL